MLIFGHRGKHDVNPENTVEAFADALSAGADGIETDLRLSRDGQVVLFHDRTTHSGNEVASLTRTELNSQVGFEVPTLEAVLDRFPEAAWDLEIKAPEVITKAAEIVKRFANKSRIIVTSFWHPAVIAFAKETHVSAGILVAHRPVSLDSLLFGISASEVDSIVWDFDMLDWQLLEEARDRGFRNIVYGAYSANDHSLLRSRNMSGVITDHLECLFPRA